MQYWQHCVPDTVVTTNCHKMLKAFPINDRYMDTVNNEIDDCCLLFLAIYSFIIVHLAEAYNEHTI